MGRVSGGGENVTPRLSPRGGRSARSKSVSMSPGNAFLSPPSSGITPSGGQDGGGGLTPRPSNAGTSGGGGSSNRRSVSPFKGNNAGSGNSAAASPGVSRPSSASRTGSGSAGGGSGPGGSSGGRVTLNVPDDIPGANTSTASAPSEATNTRGGVKASFVAFDESPPPAVRSRGRSPSKDGSTSAPRSSSSSGHGRNNTHSSASSRGRSAPPSTSYPRGPSGGVAPDASSIVTGDALSFRASEVAFAAAQAPLLRRSGKGDGKGGAGPQSTGAQAVGVPSLANAASAVITARRASIAAGKLGDPSSLFGGLGAGLGGGGIQGTTASPRLAGARGGQPLVGSPAALARQRGGGRGEEVPGPPPLTGRLRAMVTVSIPTSNGEHIAMVAGEDIVVD